MKNKRKHRRSGTSIVLVFMLFFAGVARSGFSSNTNLLDFRASWRSEVSQGHYASYEFIVRAASTNQLTEILLHGGRRAGPEESLDLLVTQHLVTISVDQKTQFRNLAQTGVISAADNPLNAPVETQTVAVTEESMNLLISNTLSSFVAKTDRVQVHTIVPPYLLPVDVELKGPKINLRGALNQIGKAVAAGWAVRCEYAPETGYGVTLEFASLPRRKQVPMEQPTPNELPTKDPESLLGIARAGNRNERRLAEQALMGYVSDEKVLKKIQGLALEFLKGPDIQLRYDVVAQLPFIFKFPYDEPALSVEKRFPDRAKEISGIRGSMDLKYQDLVQLLKTGDSLERGLACERLEGEFLNSPQFTPSQINDVWAILVSLLEDKDVFVRWESGTAMKGIVGLTTSNQQVP